MDMNRDVSKGKLLFREKQLFMPLPPVQEMSITKTYGTHKLYHPGYQGQKRFFFAEIGKIED